MTPVKSNPSDIRLFLQSELVRRCKSNPKYSLRAFARTLGIESSALSKILNGKRMLTKATLKKIAAKLSLSPQAFQSFEQQVVERRGRSKSNAATAEQPVDHIPDYQQMALDHFQVISDWYHFAILELIAVDGFQPSPIWIARCLGTSVAEIQAAVERLQRIGYLEITKNGKWLDRAGDVTNIDSNFTAAAYRKLQEQILTKALDALEEVPLELRDNTGMTMAIDQDRLPEAKKRITRFRRELCAFLQSGQKKTAVYHMGIALYPVTRSKTNNKSGDLK